MALPRDDPGAVRLVEARRDVSQDDLAGRPAGVDALVEDRPATVDPSLVQAPQRVLLLLTAGVDQPRRPLGLVSGQPALHASQSDAQLVRLRLLALRHRPLGATPASVPPARPAPHCPTGTR